MPVTSESALSVAAIVSPWTESCEYQCASIDHAWSMSIERPPSADGGQRDVIPRGACRHRRLPTRASTSEGSDCVKAIICEQWGPPSGLRWKEMPSRPLEIGQARIRVRASGINFADVLMVGGTYQVKP